MIGKMELVAWDNSYGMIMSSIIYNLKNNFHFANKSTYLQKQTNGWDVKSVAIWSDSSTSDPLDKCLKFSLGSEKYAAIK